MRMKSISRPAVGSVDVLMFIFSFGQHEKTSTHNNSTALLVIGTWLEPTQTCWGLQVSGAPVCAQECGFK